jgi:L-iditol 2-dehydrogenase
LLAARLYGIKDIRIEDIEIPTINDNEVLLKVKSAAICGTDIRMFNNGLNGVDSTHPRILGHELSGIVSSVGRNVKKYKEGMRVAVAPNMGCGLCEQCVGGNTHLCSEYRALGINEDGGFAEYVRIPESAVRQGNIIELGDNVTFDEAAINEPFSCVYNGFLQYAVKPGNSVLIIGAGPIGILHAKLAKMAGAAKVIINDLSQERLDICKKIDSFFITIGNGNLKEEVMGLTHQRGLDVCVTACPSPQAQAASLDLMAIGGRINFFGGLPKDRENVSINTNVIHYKQLVLTGSTRASITHFRKTLEFISGGIVSVKELVSQRYTLDEILKGFEMAGNASGLKNVIYFK